jgi:hypothetical protein
MASVPRQPSYNVQDDTVPVGTAKQGVTSSPAAGLFGIANRSVQKDGVLPAYPSDDVSAGAGPAS